MMLLRTPAVRCRLVLPETCRQAAVCSLVVACEASRPSTALQLWALVQLFALKVHMSQRPAAHRQKKDTNQARPPSSEQGSQQHDHAMQA